MSDQPMPSPVNQDRRFTLGRLGAALVLAVLLLAVFSLTVIETGQVGVMIRSGSDQVRVIAEPGIYARLPFVDRVWLIDSRLQTSEQPTTQAYTSVDKQTLQLAGWVAWRVTDPVRFNTTTASGKRPVTEPVLRALLETLTDWVSNRPAAVLLRGQFDAASPAWLSALNQRLAPLGLEAELAGLRQVGLAETETADIYARMSAARTRTARQLIDGLAADERQLVGVQNRQQAQVLDDAYRAAQQIRQNAENQLLAAYARQYGPSRGFAETLKNPPRPTEKIDQSPNTNE